MGKQVAAKRDQLRFAIFVRVSTEGQGKKGESLSMQRDHLTKCVKQVGGVLVKMYGGQEHATAGFDRPRLAELLNDAKTGLFNAVMVWDQSRLAREAGRFYSILKELRECGISFWEKTTERDPNDPNDMFMMGIAAASHQWQVDIHREKGLAAKIERARRHWPACGGYPFGRRLKNPGSDRSGWAEWEIDPTPLPGSTLNAKEWVEQAWHLYVHVLKDLRKVAKAMGLREDRYTTVQQRLFKRSGATWPQTFAHRDGYVETIETPMPPLLSDAKMAAAQAAAKVHRQYVRISGRTDPLANVVRCAVCGEKLHCQFQKADKKSRRKTPYRSYVHRKTANRTDRCVKQIRAAKLEGSAFQLLAHLLSSNRSFEESIASALGETKARRRQLEEEREALAKRLAAVRRSVQRLVIAVDQKTLSNADVGVRRAELRREEETLLQQLRETNSKLAALEIDVPSDTLKRVKQAMRHLAGGTRASPEFWTAEAQAKLAHFLFGQSNKALGVFVRVITTDWRETAIEVEVRGVIGIASDLIAKKAYEDAREDRYYKVVPAGDVPEEGLRDVIESVGHKPLRTSQKAQTALHSAIDGRLPRAAPRPSWRARSSARA